MVSIKVGLWVWVRIRHVYSQLGCCCTASFS